MVRHGKLTKTDKRNSKDRLLKVKKMECGYFGTKTEKNLRPKIIQMVNSERKMRELPIQTIDTIPPLGKIVVENLNNGEIREGMIPEDGQFRLAIPCDGLNPAEKRLAAGIPEEGPEEDVEYNIPNNDGLGDLLRITIYDEEGNLLHTIENWDEDSRHGKKVDVYNEMKAVNERMNLLEHSIEDIINGGNDGRKIGKVAALRLDKEIRKTTAEINGYMKTFLYAVDTYEKVLNKRKQTAAQLDRLIKLSNR